MNGPSAFLLLNIFDGETQLSLWADNPQYCDPTLGILTLFSPKSYILNSLLQCTEATEAHFWSAEFKLGCRPSIGKSRDQVHHNNNVFFKPGIMKFIGKVCVSNTFSVDMK